MYEQVEMAESLKNTMDEDHYNLQRKAVRRAEFALTSIQDQLSSIVRWFKTNPENGPAGAVGLKRTALKYAFNKKKLDESIEEFEKWQGIQDMTWLLTLQVVKTVYQRDGMPHGLTPSVEQVVKAEFVADEKGLSLQHEVLASITVTDIPYFDGKYGIRKQDHMILDTIIFTQLSKWEMNQSIVEVRDLVRKLRKDTQSVGLLEPKGFFKEADESGSIRFMIPFPLPNNLTQPQSLRAALLSTTGPNLTTKIGIGLDLASCVSHMHILNFVHKNIRPETILLFNNTATNSISTYLVGFQDFRKDGGRTALLGDDDWAKNIYRHPRRFGTKPGDAYIMQHDIYSLGVCLLEIGLWSPLVEYPDPATRNPSAHLDPESFFSGVTMKNRLLLLAERHLPHNMGTLYTDVVKTCLTCLDEDNGDFGDDSEFYDEDGILVGIRYIEKVLLQLKDIRV